MAKRDALGRGLGALLGDVDPLQDTRDIHRIVSGNPAAVNEARTNMISCLYPNW